MKIDFGRNFDRFDAHVEPHYHLICDRFGAVIDLDIPVDQALNEYVAATTAYTVNRHRIEFYGLCDVCQAADKK